MKKKIVIWYCIIGISINSCVDDRNFSTPIVNCVEPELEVTNTIAQIKEMAGFGVVEFTNDFIRGIFTKRFLYKMLLKIQQQQFASQ